MSAKFEMSNVNLKVGARLKIKGEILPDAQRFQIDLGYDSQDLALHFNPRFHDDTDGAVIVCNSKIAGCWGEEKREMHNPLHRGTHVKIVLKLTGDMFEVELPDGYEIQFPNRGDMAAIDYVKITGDFKVTCIKIC
ncbi:galectin-1-like [Hippocampus comes]|uniref:galectin-1-like n=1 Tax=Hippocampus comes TaxID=109280 RepID=UPI00094E3142|nr:PREDICTED: galectin-1-like [Hippocampus comes]